MRFGPERKRLKTYYGWHEVKTHRCLANSAFFDFQLVLIVSNELFDFVRHREELVPLLLVESDRKSTQPVHGNRPFLAHFHRHSARSPLLERFILGLEPLQLSFQIFIRHCDSLSQDERSVSATLAVHSQIDVTVAVGPYRIALSLRPLRPSPTAYIADSLVACSVQRAQVFQKRGPILFF